MYCTATGTVTLLNIQLCEYVAPALSFENFKIQKINSR